MTTASEPTPAAACWRPPALLAVGLGTGPVLAALAPWPPLSVAAAVAGALLLGCAALRAEQRVAALDLERGRTPLRWPFAIVADASLSTASLVALACCVQATWALAGLLQAATGAGSLAAPADGGGWSDNAGNELGLAGWRGSAGLLLALLGVLAAVLLLVRGSRPGRMSVRLLLAALALQAAVAACGWWSRPPALAELAGPWTWPADWRDVARQAGAGFATGVLATGAGLGLLQARALLEGRSPSGSAGRAALLAPVAILFGTLAALPWCPLLPQAPFMAPGADGGAAAALLLEPLATQAGTGWHLAWLTALLLASLAALTLALQPARLVLQGLLGLTKSGCSWVLAGLLATLALPCLLLPGLLARLPALLAGAALASAALWLAADPPRGLARRWLRLLAGLVALGAALSGLHPATSWALGRLPPGWDEAALSRQAALLPWLVPLLGLLWWPLLLLLAAWRARTLSRAAADADPAAPRRTPA